MAPRPEPLALSEEEQATLRQQGYEIQGAFACGAYGTVFYATYTDDNNNQTRPLVVKQMNTEREKGAESAQMELTVLRRYPHRYIVELVHHFRAATGHELLFLERMQGGSLIDLLAQYEPDEENVRIMYRQFGSAVAFLHVNGIAHFDLKPGNILISGDLEVTKLADFGMVMPSIDSDTGERLMTNAIGGTKPYVAPEVAINAAYVLEQAIATQPIAYWPIPADVWSMGIIVYELLHFHLAPGRAYPYVRPNPPSYWNLFRAIRAIFQRTGPQTATLVLPANHILSPLCEAFLRRHLQMRPENRASMEELLEDPWVKLKPPPVPVAQPPANGDSGSK